MVDQGGIALGAARPEPIADPRLRGTKHRAAEEREVTVVRGASDGRTVILVPEAKGAEVTGHDAAARAVPRRACRRTPAKRVLSGYRTRYAALADAVTETEPVFDDELLGDGAVGRPAHRAGHVLAERWRHSVG